MATLEKIRSKAALLVVVIGVALLAFIIGDFLQSGSTFFNQNKEKVAVVNGQAISIQEYQQRVEQMTEMYRSRGALTEDMQHQIRQSIFNQMVNTILLKEEANKLGIAVSKDERADIILGNNISPTIQQMPDFQNQQGVFDKNLLLQFLQMIESDNLNMYPAEYQQQILASRANWAELETSIVEEKLANKLSVILNSAITANSLDAKASFNETSVNVDFDYASQAFSSVPDTEVTVTDAEISQLYNQRKESFKQDESKIIDYIAVNIVPSSKDFQDIESLLSGVRTELTESNSVAELVNDNSDIPYRDIYSSSDQLSGNVRAFVENAQIGSVEGPVLENNTYHLYKLIDTKQAPDSAFVYALTLPSYTDEALVTQLADSLIGVIKGGKTFAEMASEATNGQGNGEMGWQTEPSLLSNGADITFIQGVFNAELNKPFVLKSALSSHLVMVTEKTKPVTKYKVAEISVAVTPSSDTYNKLYNDLNQFISQNNNPTAFKEAAEGAGYVCMTDVHVFKNQNSIAPIQNSRQVIRWTFETKPSKISDIFECDDYFVAATVTGATKEGYRPLADVSEFLKRELLNKKKGEKMVADLKSKNLSTLEDYAQAMNATVQNTKFVTFNTPRITGIGADPIVNAKAIASQVGALTGPFAGNTAVYVLSLTNKSSEGEFNEANVKMQMQMQNSYRFMQAINSGMLLQENAKIEDNRARFY